MGVLDIRSKYIDTLARSGQLLLHSECSAGSPYVHVVISTVKHCGYFEHALETADQIVDLRRTNWKYQINKT